MLAAQFEPDRDRRDRARMRHAARRDRGDPQMSKAAPTQTAPRRQQ